MNHLLAGLAELMEMWGSSFSLMYRSKMEAVVTPLLSFPLHLPPLVHPIFTYISLYVAKQHFETAHSSSHFLQQNPLFPYTQDTFTLT